MKLLTVRQKLISRPLPDVASEVRAQLDSLEIKPPSGRVAIPVGSRGIANLPTIIRTAGDWLREQGAEPFMVPAMGSHNGATAEGQQQMIESLGITAEAIQMPIQSSMDCVKLATVATGNVWMDKHCYEADGVLVIKRSKLHTCFSGPVQSGLTKMMVVGIGKIQSAETFHSSPTPVMKDMLLEMGQAIVATGKIWAGLAILEDGFDETAELHAVPAQNILSREPDYLAKHRDYFPAIPLDQLNVLIVDQIGKTFSGTGMDTNVIGYRGVRGYEDLDRPCIKIIGALGLSQATQGNAIGVGLADFITKRLRDAIDEKKTYINVYTTGEMERAKIPATMENDEALVAAIQHRYGSERWMFIPNTLHLDHLYASVDLQAEIEKHPRCTIEGEPLELEFEAGDHLLKF